MKSYFGPLVEDAEVDDSVEDEERAIEIANTDGKGKVELKKSYGESDMMKVAYSKFEDEEKATFIPYGKRTENFEKSDEEREWVNLPADIISQILSGIPMESLIRCMFVCKRWYVLTKDPCFIELQLSKAICQPPLLILSGYMGSPYKDEGIFLIDKVRDKLKARRILKEIHGYLLKIEGSCNGLLCVSSGSIDIRIFVCNPITGEYIMLPKSKLLELKLKCWDFFQSETGFAFDPTCNKYKVVCLYDVWISKNERMCMGEIITLGQSSWREINIPYTVIHLYRGSRVVFLDGALHWLIGDTNNYFPNQILVFDINTEEFRSIDIPPPTEDVMDSTHLIKFENSLAVVQFSDNRMHLWKIVGNKTKGYLWNKDYFDISMMKDDFHLLYALELVDMLENGSFLLDVKRATFNSSDEDESLPENSGNLLLLCFPAKREYFHVGISGIRGWHDVAYFVPSLVSPCAAVAAVNGGCQRGI